MKKTCANCYYGFKGRKGYLIVTGCRKLGTNINMSKDRSGCHYWCITPPFTPGHDINQRLFGIW